MNFVFPGIAEPLNVRLFSASYATAGSWWAESDRIRDVWRLYLNEADGIALRIGSELHPLPANRLVLVPAGLEFDVVVDSPVKQFFVYFEFVGWPAKAAQEIVPGPVFLDPEPLRDALLMQVIEEVKLAKEIEPVIASRLKALVHLASADALAQARRLKRRARR